MDDAVDLTALFPEYDKADGRIGDDGVVYVRLYSGRTYTTMRLNMDAMLNSLEKLRRAKRKKTNHA